MKDTIEDALDRIGDAQSAISDAESAISAAEGILERLDGTMSEVSDAVLDAVKLGLPMIEFKYGLSSKEATDVRKFITDAED